MKLSDLLVDSWVVAPVEADDLAGALEEILARVAEQDLLGRGRVRALARELASGRQGESVRIDEQVVLVLGTLEGLAQPAMGLAIAPRPVAADVQGRGGPGTARVVALVLAARRLSGLRQELVPAFTRAFREPDRRARLVAARSSADIREITELMETRVRTRLVVEDALVPVKYRVYPDTPLDEVVDLIVRRGVHAVPVVGERYEVLGILTAGDALEHILREGRRSKEERPRIQHPTARDFMTRSVLCVSEDQALVEAGNMMVNRDVEQIPVVREGELVGFITRDSILRALRGALVPEADLEEESEVDS